MSLVLISSNRVELLQSRLAQTLSDNPLKNPFAQESIVVPTFAMGRWLNLRLAQQLGIAANIDYPQPAEWVWATASRILQNPESADHYSGHRLSWQIFDLLPEFLHTQPFAALRSYLQNDQSGIKRWQLSLRIGQCFDRYQSYRPSMISAWSSGNKGDWQAMLWRKILDQRGLPHRGQVIRDLIEALRQGRKDIELGQRLSLFSLSSLPPLYLELIKSVAERTEITLYLHSPSDQYWADLQDRKRKSRLGLSNPQAAALIETGNELLSSWGQQGQVFQDTLLDQASLNTAEVELFSPPQTSALLGKIQQSIFSLNANPKKATADDSISLHICHSRVRECEVLLDQLMAELQQNPQLEPEDILVMVPDIASYAPCIEAAFRFGPVSYNISDITLASEDPLATTFLQLLKLPQCRFTQSEIFSLLDNPALRQKFKIDEASIDLLQSQLQQANVRWGIDSAHRDEIGLPPTDANTWQQASDRYFAGFALADAELWEGISPLPNAATGEFDLFGHFWHLLHSLKIWRQRLGGTRSATEWQMLLLQLLEHFFITSPIIENRLQQIRDTINDLNFQSDAPLTAELIDHLMEASLSRREQSGQLYSGGVTVCGMRPMRSIPFKMICLLGMNRTDFPRQDSHSDIDLLLDQPGQADPAKRQEDRYLMLETLLCAREKLYISYRGRSLKDNSENQPSVMVQELLDFIDRSFLLNSSNSDTNQKFSAQVIHQHPMQVFSTTAFVAPHFSFNRHGFALAKRLADPPSINGPWPIADLSATTTLLEIDSTQLSQFLRHPIRYFFQHRLGIYLGDDRALADDETFDLDALEGWMLKQQLANDILNQRNDSQARLVASGMLAHGPAGVEQIEQVQLKHPDWLQQIENVSSLRAETRLINLTLNNGIILKGSVSNYYSGTGLIAIEPGKFKGPQLLSLWLQHLLLIATGQLLADENSRLLNIDRTHQLNHLSVDQAQTLLQNYCQLFDHGMRQPLPIFPETSHAWAKASARENGLVAVNKIWQKQNSFQSFGDVSDAYLQLALRQYDYPFETALFNDCAERLYQPLLNLVEKV